VKSPRIVSAYLLPPLTTESPTTPTYSYLLTTESPTTHYCTVLLTPHSQPRALRHTTVLSNIMFL
jgi:hypothetical protein